MVFLPASAWFWGETTIFRLQRNLASIGLIRTSDKIEVRRAKNLFFSVPQKKFMLIK